MAEEIIDTKKYEVVLSKKKLDRSLLKPRDSQPLWQLAIPPSPSHGPSANTLLILASRATCWRNSPTPSTSIVTPGKSDLGASGDIGVDYEGMGDPGNSVLDEIGDIGVASKGKAALGGRGKGSTVA
ncbi:Uncharacterized protein Fot_27976 [Forsythia ovata]|uniref:Uncharacterized protein n=1 Tax=Forsythia ovata TaxID=205694 RepID=A0ABD1TMP0_9LAMI